MAHCSACGLEGQASRSKTCPQKDSESISPKRQRLEKDNDVQQQFECDVRQQLECPVCFSYMLPPIRQCPNGHTLCNSCSQKCSECPQCRATPINIRALALENLAAGITFTCPHKARGCLTKLKYKELAAHSDTCPFQYESCPCPMEDCSATLRLNNKMIVDHLVEVHELEKAAAGADGSYEENYKVDSDSGIWGPFLLEAHDTTFLLVVADCGALNFRACVTGLGEDTAFVQKIACKGHARESTFKGPIIATAEWANASLCPTSLDNDEGLVVRKSLATWIHSDDDEDGDTCFRISYRITRPSRSA